MATKDSRSAGRRPLLQVERLEDRANPSAPLVEGHWAGRFDIPAGSLYSYPYQHFAIAFNLKPGVGSTVFGTERVSVVGSPQVYEIRKVSGQFAGDGVTVNLTSGAVVTEVGKWWPANTASFKVPDVFPSGTVQGTFTDYPNSFFGFERAMNVHHVSGPATQAPPLQVTTSTGQSTFVISNAPAMPVVSADVSEVGATTDLSAIHFTWKAQLSFTGAETPGGQAEPTLTVTKTTAGAHLDLNPQIWGRIRGGELTLTANAIVNGEHVSISLGTLSIQGTNPTPDQVRAALGSDVLRQIAHQESDFQQFGADGWPLFNTAAPSEVGVMQVKPTQATAWDWRTNVAAGKTRFAAAKAGVASYVSALRASPEFLRLAKATNDARVSQGLSRVQISIPPLTADQVLDDAIRGYDGWYGNDPVAARLPLHEFRLQLDSNGLLELQPTSNPKQERAVWEEVPPTDRPQTVGDPDFVAHVLAQTP